MSVANGGTPKGSIISGNIVTGNIHAGNLNVQPVGYARVAVIQYNYDMTPRHVSLFESAMIHEMPDRYGYRGTRPDHQKTFEVESRGRIQLATNPAEISQLMQSPYANTTNTTVRRLGLTERELEDALSEISQDSDIFDDKQVNVTPRELVDNLLAVILEKANEGPLNLEAVSDIVYGLMTSITEEPAANVTSVTDANDPTTWETVTKKFPWSRDADQGDYYVIAKRPGYGYTWLWIEPGEPVDFPEESWHTVHEALSAAAQNFQDSGIDVDGLVKRLRNSAVYYRSKGI